MKQANRVLWGIILIGLGVLLGLNAFGITDFNLFFDGWWTLFIIVPSAVGLLTNHDKTGNLIGLCIGVLLLLFCRDILSFDMLWKLAIPAIIILFGIKLLFGGRFDKACADAMKKLQDKNGEVKYGTAVFSGENMNFSGEFFQGAELNAVFGGVECDLRNAVIEQDCVIRASAIFGGIDIFAPDNINIRVTSNSIFGGVSGKKNNPKIEGAPTLYINGTAIFGGVEIK